MRVKLLKLEPKNSKKAPYFKAVADIQLGNLLEIHGVKLIQGEDGKLFMAMPSHRVGDQYVNDVVIRDLNVLAQIRTLLLGEYSGLPQGKTREE